MILQCKSSVLQMHVQLVWAGELILLALLVWRRKSGWMIDWRLSVDGRTHFGWGWMLETFLYNITGVMEAHTNWPRGMLDTPGTHHRVSVCLNSYFPKWKAVGYLLFNLSMWFCAWTIYMYTHFNWGCSIPGLKSTILPLMCTYFLLLSYSGTLNSLRVSSGTQCHDFVNVSEISMNFCPKKVFVKI